MQRYHLLYCDLFAPYPTYRDYLSGCFRLQPLGDGDLFDVAPVKSTNVEAYIRNEIVTPFPGALDITMERANGSGLLFEGLNGMLDNNRQVASFITAMKQRDYELDRIWYVHCPHLAHMVADSIKRRGRGSFEATYERAVHTNRLVREVFESIPFSRKSVLNATSFTAIPEAVKQEILAIAGKR